MRFAPQQNTALFIGGADPDAATHGLGSGHGSHRPLHCSDTRTTLPHACYSALSDTAAYSPLKPLNRYSLVTKPGRKLAPARLAAVQRKAVRLTLVSTLEISRR